MARSSRASTLRSAKVCDDSSRPPDHSAELTSLLISDIGTIATLGDLVCAPRLPKTRSGKTLRRTVKDLVKNAAKGRLDAPASYPPTIEDVGVVEEVRQVVNAYFSQKGPEKVKAKL